MATIDIIIYKGKPVFFVQCTEPFTKITMKFCNFSWLKTPIEKNTVLPYDRIWLKAIVKTCQGANMKQIGYKEISLSREVDEQYDFILALIPANILALKSSNFHWSKTAGVVSVILSIFFPVSNEKIKSVQDIAITQLINNI